MVKKMLINASHTEECRVAVVCDGVLEELDVAVKTHEPTLGNIYKAVVSRVEPSLQAVFVDYGASRNGFLSINDVHPSYFPESFEGGRRRPRIQDVFKKDDHVLVQVNKEERQHKGASLTTNISIAGRYLVLMPGTELCGVSRKIEDEEERKKLKEILKQLKMPENMGFIIRTAGMGRTKTDLIRDLDYLLRLWQSIETTLEQKPSPCLLHKEHDVVIRSIREHFSSDISELLVDDKEVHRRVRDFFHQVMPRYENLVKLYQEKRPLFNKYQLEEQIEQVYRKRINLKSGGYILIEPTEAMVTVDVNSGGATKEKGIEETAFRVNMEAAPEIARQLRLRDLGGIIVIDFIDMVHKNHKQEVEKAVKAVLKKDRAKSKVLRISTLGLLELSRQRLKSSLGTGEYLDCPLCDGHGKVRSPEMAALSVFRRIKSMLIKSDVAEVKATVPARVAEYLLNRMRSPLVELENQHGSRITIQVRHALPDKDIAVEAIREEITEQPIFESIEEHLPLPVAGEVEVRSEEPVEGEEEKRQAKKPGRRRRRTKKRPEPPREEEIPSEVIPEYGFVEEELVSAEIEEEGPAEPRITLKGEDFFTPGTEDLSFPSEEPPPVEMEAQAEVRDEELAVEAEEIEVRPEEPIPAATEAVDEGVSPDSEPQQATAPEEPPKEEEEEKTEPRKRRFSLQRFLPFS
ncbi:MAG: Rne/Rng family ribonuclease [Desulfomonile tiedjei]|nr:Rne/Rng family ribonuclease [Desulfomonile tiedjei]